jgi:hypothetical protein
MKIENVDKSSNSNCKYYYCICQFQIYRYMLNEAAHKKGFIFES